MQDISHESETFEAYASEYTSLMEQMATTTDPSHKQALLAQGQELLQQMAVEARTELDAVTRRQLLDRHAVYKSQCQSIKLQIDREALLPVRLTSQPGQQQPSPSLGAVGDDTLLNRQNAVLNQAVQSIQETENLAIGIAANLSEQRDTLERTSTNAKEMKSMTATANQIATNLLKPWWRKGI